MALSDYNGFPGKMRESVGRRMERSWKDNPALRPSRCDACFQTEGALHGHNEDYSQEDVYLPICITCHLILHMRFQQPKMWTDYKTAVRAGFQGKPLVQKSALWVIKDIYPREFYENSDQYINEPRTATVLDMISPIKFIHPSSVQYRSEMCAVGEIYPRQAP